MSPFLGLGRKGNITSSRLLVRGKRLTEIGKDCVYIIAEIGQNHQGELDH